MPRRTPVPATTSAPSWAYGGGPAASAARRWCRRQRPLVRRARLPGCRLAVNPAEEVRVGGGRSSHDGNGGRSGATSARLRRRSPPSQSSASRRATSCTCSSADGDATVKVRDGLLDVKGLLAVDDDGLEQWVPVAKRPFPVSRDDVGAVLARLRVDAPPLDREAYALEELAARVVRPIDALRARRGAQATHPLHGRRLHGRDLRDPNGRGSTRIARDRVRGSRRACMAALRSLGLAARANVCMARGLKTLAGFAATRYAVIDVGTNSVKLHVGERRADGTWSDGRRPRRGHPAGRGPRRDRRARARADGAHAARRSRRWPTRRARPAPPRSLPSAPPGCAPRRTPPSSSAPSRPAAASGSRSSPARRRRRLAYVARQVGARPGARLARRLRHRRRQLPVHLRPRRRRRRAVQRAASARCA